MFCSINFNFIRTLFAIRLTSAIRSSRSCFIFSSWSGDDNMALCFLFISCTIFSILSIFCAISSTSAKNSSMNVGAVSRTTVTSPSMSSSSV
uniref:Uncharacterized protein n=1 Tax=Ixodes ricinus TaxID=34613 RepID=A0A6B0U1K7_IXORI